MHQPHLHRHPHENYSFTFKCLAALAVTTAVIALPLLIIPFFLAVLLYALVSNNQQPTVWVTVAREGGFFDGISTFFRLISHPPQYPSGHFHQHRENAHYHHPRHHDASQNRHGHAHCSSAPFQSHHHGHS